MTIKNIDLIKKAQKGEIQAFDELVKTYDRQVLSIALKYTGDEDDAKDIYQDVFIRVYKGLKKFEFNCEFSTWIYRIATNVCLDYTKRMKKRVFVSTSINDDEDPILNELPVEDNVYEKTLRGEISQKIEKALESLSPKIKMSFVLKHFEGYKIREIADMMNCQEGTIKKYLFDANNKMKILLKDFTNY